MEAPSLSSASSANLISRLASLSVSNVASTPGVDSPNHPTYQAVCKNWALGISKEKNISIEEAYSVIGKLVSEKTADEKKKIDLLHALESLNWENDPIFDDTEEYPFYALAGLKEGSLSVVKFTTLMFYRTCVLYHDNKNAVKSLPMFILDPASKEMVVNPLAKKIVIETCKPRESTDGLGQRVMQGIPQLTDTQIDQFFEEMSKKPISEQQFFIMPDTFISKEPIKKIDDNPEKLIENLFKDKNLTKEQLAKAKEAYNNTSIAKNLSAKNNRSIIEIFYHDQGFNPLNFFTEGSIRKRMVPSFSMMQAFVDVKHPNSVKINPVIGLSPIEPIFDNAKNRTREMGLAFVDKPLPTTADDKSAPGFDFIYHDFYHVNVFAYFPQQHVDANLKMIDILGAFKEKSTSPEMQKFTERMIEKIIDLEGISYEPLKSLPDDDIRVRNIFWDILNQSLQVVVAAIANEKSPGNMMQESMELFETIHASEFFKFFAEKIHANAAFFESKGLPITDMPLIGAQEAATMKAIVIQSALQGSGLDPIMLMFMGKQIMEQIEALILPTIPKINKTLFNYSLNVHLKLLK